MTITTEQTVSTFLDFYRDRGHHRITGSTLLPPPGDPVLFTTSGMHPLTPYLTGCPHPLGNRLVNVQRCLRTTDLDEVGDLTHLTVFEMLGSWSLGDDYSGPQSLRWGYELLRDGFGVDTRRLHATVFGGDGQVGPDTESLRTWQDLGVPVEPTTDDNWWSNGPTGPCGPDSEIFVWTGDTPEDTRPQDSPPQGTPTTDPRWVEVWNHVMMRHQRHPDGSLTPLPRPNVDTGMGLERLLTVLQGKSSVFDTDLFEPWTRTLPLLWGLNPQGDPAPFRLVCDHLRSSLVVLGDGVGPSSNGRGYVPRRLVRRVLTTLWREHPTATLSDLPRELLEHTADRFRQPADQLDRVRELLLDEERRFAQQLDRGRLVLTRLGLGPGKSPTEQDYAFLHGTHGLPRDLIDTLLDPPGRAPIVRR